MSRDPEKTANELTPGGNPDPSGAPVDLTHLGRYTLGDKALEREVLELFCSQSAIYLEQLRAARSDKAWSDAAHSLKGGARSVGAWRTARAAECAETLNAGSPDEIRAAQIEEIGASLQEAEVYIRSIFGAAEA